MTAFDELSLKSHLQSLPKIFQELWTVMGASGKNIKESINFVIEKVSNNLFVNDSHSLL